jgi:hypothetical protein
VNNKLGGLIVFKKTTLVLLVFLIMFCFTGCDSIDKLKIKVGLKNNDFEYIKDGKIKKIIIQNKRDEGFKFIVTDPEAINDLYDILSSAKEVNTKSSLEPDYIFEMYEKGGNVYRFNYVAGLDKEDDGNLYSDNKVYIVSKRIDNDIIKNFWNIRKPVYFENVYYNSILAVLDEFIKNNKYKSIGINFKEDLDVAKFILSTDLEEISIILKNNYANVEIENHKDYDIYMKVKTEGYKSDVYKAIMTFSNKEDSISKTYYVISRYKNEEQFWDINVFEDIKPEGF